MNAMTTTKSIGYGLALGLVASSCGTTSRSLHEDHCANQDGNDWCSDKYQDGSRPYCSRGITACEAAIEPNSSDLDGCIGTRPDDDACYSPCGGRMDVTEDASCLDGVSSSSGTETSSGTTAESSGSESGSESSTTGPMPCMGDEDCPDAAAPFCEPVSGECVACDGTDDPDGACAGLDPLQPLCVGGECVACTPENPLVCDEQLLLCDGDTNACVPCTEHGQCGSGACELAVGTCFPPDTVVHVDGDGGQDFMTVAAAVASVGGGLHGVIVVHEQDSGLGYPGAVIDGGKVVALLTAPGEAPVLQGTGGNPGLTVEGAGTILYVDGLRVSLSAGLGLRVNGALAWVDGSRIVQNSGGGVLAENGAELTLRNCFVGGDDNTAAVDVDGATARITFSTLGGGTITATGLSCTAPDAVEVRSSVIVALGIMATGGVDVACSVADITYTATEASFMGTGNVAVGELPFMTPEDWFGDYGTGDFHLQND
jgi:hypothetical protein